MISNDTDTLQDGSSFYDYHKDKIKRFISFKNTKGSNFDNLTKIKDSTDFQLYQELDEQDKAHSIDYAHGLELDDIGDDVSIYRNGLDDETYRFLIRAHQLSSRSKGTFRDLNEVAKNLLGCKPEDISMSNARVLDADKKDNGGDTNTVVFNEIEISNALHAKLVDFLPQELQKAACAGYHVLINDILFTTNNFNNLCVSSTYQEETEVVNKMSIQENHDSRSYLNVGADWSEQTVVTNVSL